MGEGEGGGLVLPDGEEDEAAEGPGEVGKAHGFEAGDDVVAGAAGEGERGGAVGEVDGGEGD